MVDSNLYAPPQLPLPSATYRPADQSETRRLTTQAIVSMIAAVSLLEAKIAAHES